MDLGDPRKIYKDFKSDKIKNANLVVDLLKELEGSNVKQLRKAIAVTHKIFCQLIKDGDIKDVENIKSAKKTPKNEFDRWLYERYEEVHRQLLKMTLNDEFPRPLREVSLIAVMKLLQKEANKPFTHERINGSFNFPVKRLKNVYSSLLLHEASCQPYITKLKEYLQCPDFLFISLHILAEIVPENSKEYGRPFFFQNLMNLLELLTLPSEKAKSLDEPVLFASDVKQGESSKEENSPKKAFDFPYKQGKKYFNAIWESVLTMNFTSDVYRRCLVLLPEKVMMHLDEPVRLTDFFMNAYTVGGVVSILAMHGIFILITEYNLEYPDFYEKVYALLEPSVFHEKYKARFFKLCSKFFLSPYLPEYIVAAFIKRLCRLMLTAPSPCIILMIKFVINLLIRFPSLKKLINNPSATSVEDDPYVPEEPNLLMCRAGESSLWELATMRQHPLYGIAKSTIFLERNLPDLEYDLSKCVNDTYEDLYARASKIKTYRVATTFYKPDSLFKYSEDIMSESWDIL